MRYFLLREDDDMLQQTRTRVLEATTSDVKKAAKRYETSCKKRGPVHKGGGDARRCCVLKTEPIAGNWSVHTAHRHYQMTCVHICAQICFHLSLGPVHTGRKQKRMLAQGNSFDAS